MGETGLLRAAVRVVSMRGSGGEWTEALDALATAVADERRRNRERVQRMRDRRRARGLTAAGTKPKKGGRT